jgi:hypothetical protein
MNSFRHDPGRKEIVRAAVLRARWVVALTDDLLRQCSELLLEREGDWEAVSLRQCVIPQGVEVTPSFSAVTDDDALSDAVVVAAAAAAVADAVVADADDALSDAFDAACSELCQAFGVPARSHVFLLPCGLRPVKRPCALVRPMRELVPPDRNAASPVVLALVGPPLSAETLAEVDEAFERAESPPSRRPFLARYHAPVARDVLLRWMVDPQCRGVVNCSSSEGHPNALLEAMAVGALAIASDIPGNANAVRNGETGVLAESDDALCRVMLEVVSDFEAGTTERWGEMRDNAQREVSDGRFSVASEFLAWQRVLCDL